MIVVRLTFSLRTNQSRHDTATWNGYTDRAGSGRRCKHENDKSSIESLIELQVVYFHAGSELSYRRIQSNLGGKGGFTSIPVIDISQIDSASLDDRKAIARELYDSCSTSGFFYIANHGVCFDQLTFKQARLANSTSGLRVRAKVNLRCHEIILRS
jgi:hypothetical protein